MVQWWLRHLVVKMFIWIVWPLVFSRRRPAAHPFPTDAPTIFQVDRNWNTGRNGVDPEPGMDQDHLGDPAAQGQDDVPVPQEGLNRWCFGWLVWLGGGVGGRIRRRVLLRYVAWLVLLFAIVRAQMALYAEDSGSSRTAATPT